MQYQTGVIVTQHNNDTAADCRLRKYYNRHCHVTLTCAPQAYCHAIPNPVTRYMIYNVLFSFSKRSSTTPSCGKTPSHTMLEPVRADLTTRRPNCRPTHKPSTKFASVWRSTAKRGSCPSPPRAHLCTISSPTASTALPSSAARPGKDWCPVHPCSLTVTGKASMPRRTAGCRWWGLELAAITRTTAAQTIPASASVLVDIRTKTPRAEIWPGTVGIMATRASRDSGTYWDTDALEAVAKPGIESFKDNVRLSLGETCHRSLNWTYSCLGARDYCNKIDICWGLQSSTYQQ